MVLVPADVGAVPVSLRLDALNDNQEGLPDVVYA